MRINTNVMALNTQRILGQTENAVSTAIGRLSSGFRINQAKDDAAGLAIANKLRNTVASLQTAQRNASQASSMLQIADGATQTLSSILDRMKELATQGSSTTIGNQGDKLQNEWNSLQSELTRIVGGTQYQGTNVLTGLGTSLSYSPTAAQGTAGLNSVSFNSTASAQQYTIAQTTTAPGMITLSAADGTSETVAVSDGAQSVNFQDMGVTLNLSSGFTTSTGTTAGSLDGQTFTPTASGSAASILVGDTGNSSGPGANDTISINLGSLASTFTNLGSSDLTSVSGSQTALGTVNQAVSDLNTFIGKLGAAESRISFASQNIASTVQNTQAAESTIRDADMAKEMTTFTKEQILQQAGTAMLAQANSAPRTVLKLLG